MRVASRDCQHVVLRRPLQLLYPLEIREAENSDTGTEDALASAAIESPVDIEPRDGPVPKEPERRPMRAAAKRANKKGKGLDPRVTELKLDLTGT